MNDLKITMQLFLKIQSYFFQKNKFCFLLRERKNIFSFKRPPPMYLYSFSSCGLELAFYLIFQYSVDSREIDTYAIDH